MIEILELIAKGGKGITVEWLSVRSNTPERRVRELVRHNCDMGRIWVDKTKKPHEFSITPQGFEYLEARK